MEMTFDATELETITELDIKALEMLPADEPEGLHLGCAFTCTYTCAVTGTVRY